MLFSNLCMLSHFSHVRLCETLWTVACQVPLSMGFSRQEYRSGLLCPSSENLPNPGIEPVSLMSSALAAGFFTTSATGKLLCPWNSPGKNTGVGSHSLLHGIFLTLGLNACHLTSGLVGRFFTTNHIMLEFIRKSTNA